MSTGGSEVNLDTSVLLNYIYANLPGEIEPDEGSVALIDSSDHYCVIGPSANDEFESLCERRFILYNDLLDWLEENPDESIYEYDPTKRGIRTSSNDIDHIRLDIQHGWGDESRRKQLSDIRRCQQEIGLFQELIPEELIDQIYSDLDTNEALFEALRGLDLGKDKHIVIEAVEIHRIDGIGRLVAIDSDITDPENIELINNRIVETESPSLILDITRPDKV